MRIKPILRFYCHRMVAVAALVWAATCQTVLAQAYPTKPVQLINTSAEGGAGDFVARVSLKNWPPCWASPLQSRTAQARAASPLPVMWHGRHLMVIPCWSGIQPSWLSFPILPAISATIRRRISSRSR